MSRIVPFKQVDVFTSTPYKGNPVAVINCWDVPEEEVSQSTLQAIANWTNLSETTFLFKPKDAKCDYKVRIFTPSSELPFAGHPTVGTCQAYLEFSGRKDIKRLYQECGLGAVELTLDGKKISFKGAKTDITEISPAAADEYESALSVKLSQKPKLLEVGPKWVVALVQDAKTCYDLDLDFAQSKASSTKYDSTGLIIAGKYPNEEKYEMRAFAPREGVDEDPVCGSGSLALARYLQEINNYSSTYSFEISQGGRVSRDGKVSALISHHDGGISYYIGGEAITCINGEILLN